MPNTLLVFFLRKTARREFTTRDQLFNANKVTGGHKVGKKKSRS